MQHKYFDYTLLPCVCYLPPENSSRQFNVDSFYDHLLTCVYEYQNDGYIYICGDFNSRCGELDDFIIGVDVLPQRKVIDFTLNNYGERLIDCLINTNMCMLNGRSDGDQNYTSISVNGSSVVDYCIIPHNQLSNFTNFSVSLTSDLISACNNIANLAPISIPDHSLLSWNDVTNLTKIDEPVVQSTNKDSTDRGHVKFKLNSIPGDFMSDPSVLEQINVLIDKLESNVIDVSNIDNVYKDWCDIVKNSLYDNIPYKTVVHDMSNNCRKHKPGKPLWNTRLSDLWSNLCIAEKKWLKCLVKSLKNTFKGEYVKLRKSFDREVQKAKRIYWFHMQDNLLK